MIARHKDLRKRSSISWILTVPNNDRTEKPQNEIDCGVDDVFWVEGSVLGERAIYRDHKA